MRRLAREENGSTLPLVIFFTFLSIALIFTVVAASSLYLERKRLFGLADGAALSGAESFALDEVAVTPVGPRPTLTTPRVADAVRDYLADAETSDLQQLAVRRAESVDGRSATVTLSAVWHPPVISSLFLSGVPLEVTVVARSVFF